MKKAISALLLAAALTACSAAPAATGSKTETVTVKGFGGDVTVTVTASKDKIEKIEAKGPKETEELGGEALNTVPEAILKKNSLKVDAHSGASVTSAAIIKAVEEAITKMGFDASQFKK